MASVRSRLPPQSSLFSCTPRLGRHRPGGFPSGLCQQKRVPAAAVFPTALSVVSGHPSPGETRGSPSGSEVCRTWNNRRCTRGFSQCKRRHECDRCHGPHRSLPLRCPSAATDRRSRSRSCSPLVVRPTSLHVLLRLLRPLCLPPSPVLSSTLLW